MYRTVIERDGAFYLVSTVDVPLSGWETLVFPCTRDGEVTSWGEVVGRRYADETAAIGGHAAMLLDFQPQGA